MIKIEISDIENLDDTVLLATGRYLIDLSNKRRIQAPVVKMEGTAPEYSHPPEVKVWDAPATEELNRLHPYIPPAPKFEKPEIEEELIPVPPEVVNIPAPPLEASAPSQIFGVKPQVELDIHGMPWDIRIHARTKTKMKDGSWKKLRGVGPAVVKTVEAQLTNVQNIPAPPPSVSPQTGTPPGFTDLMSLVTKAITEGKLRRDQVTEVLKPFGIPSLPLVSTRLDLIPAIISALTGVINAPC